MLDGYLTAIIIGPRSIPPEEWFDDLFGARGHIAAASGTMLAAITTIVARFNAISRGPVDRAGHVTRRSSGRPMTVRRCRISGAWGS